MASGVHSDKRSRVGDSPRFQWESVSRCCAELYVPRPKTRLRSGLARKHLSVSRQTSIPSWGGLQYRLTTWFFLPRNLGPCSGTRFDQLGNATRRGASGGG